MLSHEEDSALLKAYIAEWGKFFTQCDYLPKPFGQLETTLTGKAHSTMQKKNQGEESIVRKVGQVASHTELINGVEGYTVIISKHLTILLIILMSSSSWC